MLTIGDKVEHLLSKDWLTVLKVNVETVECRTKDLRTVELYRWEIKKVK